MELLPEEISPQPNTDTRSAVCSVYWLSEPDRRYEAQLRCVQCTICATPVFPYSFITLTPLPHSSFQAEAFRDYCLSSSSTSAPNDTTFPEQSSVSSGAFSIPPRTHLSYHRLLCTQDQHSPFPAPQVLILKINLPRPQHDLSYIIRTQTEIQHMP